MSANLEKFRISEEIRSNKNYFDLIRNANRILAEYVDNDYPELTGTWEIAKSSVTAFHLVIRDQYSEAGGIFVAETLEDSWQVRRAMSTLWMDLVNKTARALRKRVDEAFRQPVEA